MNCKLITILQMDTASFEKLTSITILEFRNNNMGGSRPNLKAFTCSCREVLHHHRIIQSSLIIDTKRETASVSVSKKYGWNRDGKQKSSIRPSDGPPPAVEKYDDSKRKHAFWLTKAKMLLDSRTLFMIIELPLKYCDERRKTFTKFRRGSSWLPTCLG